GPTLQVDDGFDRAWRRVGIALDRSGFTVEDRDRTQGLYFVRYVDPAFAGREEPNFFSRLFSFGRKKDDAVGLAKYRVKVSGDGASSTVAVLDSQGKPETGDTGKRIAGLLLDDLK
ncbi:MAG: outer membrane protein assembly factor BamC, partial [Caldimonas sp.]